MQNHTFSEIGTFTPSPHKTGLTSHMPLRRLDPLFSSLNELGVVTHAFLEQYRSNRRKALVHMAQELVFLQSLYEGANLDTHAGDSAVRVGAMELNAHLIVTANFGHYTTAEKINILYQLRRALEILQKKHFHQ